MTELHLTLLRHGRSRADDEDVHEGRYDSPLTAVGCAQAQALATYWAAHPPDFDRAYRSTLARALETARTMTDALNLPLTPSDLLREWNNGPLAGLGREGGGQAALSHPHLPARAGRLHGGGRRVPGGDPGACPAGAGTHLAGRGRAGARRLARWLSQFHAA
ncbi:hypothetical protein HNQ08_004084 [Deinococcus humi]|uniref:Histidine phosphatase family protein n=1 Tax=Deinococcus humi TaxID=662880 RepID=A0A7W8NIE2_9DEIO|nr:hypothetical protein [Deinococcus humi]GGO34998.1 hypothetical protein GCM10008949_36670 [Deinococcus humi]